MTNKKAASKLLLRQPLLKDMATTYFPGFYPSIISAG